MILLCILTIVAYQTALVKSSGAGEDGQWIVSTVQAQGPEFRFPSMQIK